MVCLFPVDVEVVGPAVEAAEEVAGRLAHGLEHLAHVRIAARSS